MIKSPLEKLNLSKAEIEQADASATEDCISWWLLSLMLEKLKITDTVQTIKSVILYNFFFIRKLEHLKSIRPDLTSELDNI